MAARKKKVEDKNYIVKLTPLHAKRKGEVEIISVKGVTIEFNTGTVEGEYTHIEFLDSLGRTVYAVPAFRVISIEDPESVSKIEPAKSLELVK